MRLPVWPRRETPQKIGCRTPLVDTICLILECGRRLYTAFTEFNMSDQIQTLDYSYAPSAQQRNKVLRNTYWLLALSLLPTVLGAWIGEIGRAHV